MSDSPSSEPEFLTSEQRWQQWEQRGRESDARVRRRAGAALITAAAVGLGAFVLFLLIG